MNRSSFIKGAILSSIAATQMKMKILEKLVDGFDSTDPFPAMFIGHGSPMNAIEVNRFSNMMKTMGAKLPKPTAILMVSAHWETRGTFVTAQQKPPTIHDFGGFPQALFDVEYPALGSEWLATETMNAVTSTTVAKSADWGYDHGCWSVAINLYPNADVPIIQISLDNTQSAQYHYDLAKQLHALRRKGVLIIGSGNLVHNLRMVRLKDGDFNSSFGYDWAIEANEKFKSLIRDGDHQQLINYKSLGNSVQLSVPTPEHFLPALYTLALQDQKDELRFFNDDIVGGSASMTSFILDPTSK